MDTAKAVKPMYGRGRGRAAPIKNRDASVMVKNTWTVVEENAFPRLGKLSLPSVHEPDLIQCGALDYSDKIWDRVNVKNEKTL